MTVPTVKYINRIFTMKTYTFQHNDKPEIRPRIRQMVKISKQLNIRSSAIAEGQRDALC